MSDTSQHVALVTPNLDAAAPSSADPTAQAVAKARELGMLAGQLVATRSIVAHVEVLAAHVKMPGPPGAPDELQTKFAAMFPMVSPADLTQFAGVMREMIAEAFVGPQGLCEQLKAGLHIPVERIQSVTDAADNKWAVDRAPPKVAPPAPPAPNAAAR